MTMSCQDRLIASWPSWGLRSTGHLGLEVAAAFTRGTPLEPRAPVPGCACAGCTGMSDEEPASIKQCFAPDRQRRREGWERLVERARDVPVVEVAGRLGCGDPVQRGREVVVRCPLHEDTSPSLRIAPDGQRWYCFPCAEGGDAIRLWMRATRVGFAEAVRELVA